MLTWCARALPRRLDAETYAWLELKIGHRRLAIPCEIPAKLCGWQPLRAWPSPRGESGAVSPPGGTLTLILRGAQSGPTSVPVPRGPQWLPTTRFRGNFAGSPCALGSGRSVPAELISFTMLLLFVLLVYQYGTSRSMQLAAGLGEGFVGRWPDVPVTLQP